MRLSLLNILKEEIEEQGYGRYFQSVKTSSGERLGDISGYDFTKGEIIPKDFKTKTEVGSFNLFDEEFEIEGDLSGLSEYKRKGTPLKSNKYFVLHHTGGRGDAEGVINTLNIRGGLGVQWIIDREGKIYRGLPENSIGAHIRTSGYMKNGTPYRKDGMPSDMYNDNTQGVEIVGKNDSDILLTQCFSALKLVKNLGYSQSQIYTHGEINNHKMADEGQKCKTFFNENWNLSNSDIIKKYGGEDFQEKEEDEIEPKYDDEVSVDKNKNYIIGDSQVPYIDNASEKAKRIKETGSKTSLWLGGKGLSWLKSAVGDYPVSKDVNSIIISIGTNGGFNTSENISGLVDSLKEKFPKAKLFAVKGSWGWGGNKNIKESQVNSYYDIFSNNGVTVLKTPIGKVTDPHGNLPIYKTIGKEIDEKL
jgi:hypothetical protein